MSALEWHDPPSLRKPVAIIAFEGWNDASEAASGAVEYLLDRTGADEPFATFDADEFFDFQITRPTTEIGDGGTRHIEWPGIGLYAVPMPGAPHDLVVVLGDEPNLRWQRFSRSLLRTLEDLGVQRIITLGAFIGQVAHTMPVPIVGVVSRPDLLLSHRLAATDYEGPTGIVGVLNELAGSSGIEVLSIWAAIPHYLAANPNPKAALALLEHASDAAGVSVDTRALIDEVADFENRVGTAIAESDELRDYVEDLELEARPGLRFDPAVGDQLVDEIEQYLRDED